MDTSAPPFLIVNSASGSFTEQAVEAVRAALAGGDGDGARVRTFDCRADELPGRAALESAGATRLAIFAGDGTISRHLVRLEAEGWDGAVLPLPGGTQNLLSTAMFGQLSATEIAAMFAKGTLVETRRHCLRCEGHTALAEILCGPGARWADVREELRAREMGEAAAKSLDITREAASGALVRLARPAGGRAEGYPGLHFSLPDGAMVARGYRMENLGDWVRQGWAMATRDFREGPYDELGTMDEAQVEAVEGGAIDLMIDGELARAGAAITIRREPFGLSFMGLPA
ncbi:hypothetical protein [Erythrobacter sp.]|uniref:hypothetical protein n=1 Tax=Erythrobacter sp. TaxID=1042 RepID=UPI001425D180|nr:hypothetical protein [Erythrobacter sp.]QIQ86489.1 MAG: hypothetical protein G9473_07150 [Erythrobacter sp.]